MEELNKNSTIGFSQWIKNHIFLSYFCVILFVAIGFFPIGFDVTLWYIVFWKILSLTLLIALTGVNLLVPEEKNIDEYSTVTENKIPNESVPRESLDFFKDFENDLNELSNLDSKKDRKNFTKNLLTIIKKTFVGNSVLLILQESQSNICNIESFVSDNSDDIINDKLSNANRLIGVIKEGKKSYFTSDSEEIKNLVEYYSENKMPSAMLMSKISINEKIAGLLVIDSHDKSAYSEDDLTLVESYSELLSSTFSNYDHLSEFENSTKLFSFFYEINKKLNENISVTEIFELLFNIVKEVYPYDRLTISLYNKESGNAKIIKTDGIVDGNGENMEYPLEEGLNGWVIRKQKSYRLPDIEKDDLFLPRFTKNEKSNYEIRSFLGVPLTCHDSTFAVLSIESKKVDFYTERQEKILFMMANNFAAAIERSNSIKKLATLATTDDLTSLLNFRSFNQKLKEEINRAERYDFTFSLLMIDIDHFKNINDTYGHIAGNKILAKLAQCLNSSIRNVDFVYRFGGEEFAVLLVETNIEKARLLAERMRINVENMIVSFDSQDLNITVSIGVVDFPNESIKSADNMIDEADKALFRAKEQGRNKVVTSLEQNEISYK